VALKLQHTIVRHGQDRNLCDGAITALNTTSTFVHGSQVSIHVTGVTTTTRNFFSCSGDFTKGVTVGGKVSHDGQDVLLQLVGVVFGGGQGETRSNDTLNPVHQVSKAFIAVAGVQTYVGSLAKFRNRVTRSMLPFSSKSRVKKRLVSMLTPIAAKTIEKFSS